MTAPQSPAPAQSLLDEMATVLRQARGQVAAFQLDAGVSPEGAVANVRYIDQMLSRYRAAKAAEPDLVAALSKWMTLSTNPQISAETYWRARPKLEQESRAALAAAQAKEGRDE